MSQDRPSKRPLSVAFAAFISRAARATAMATTTAALAAACGGKDPYSPGTKLGTFHVTARLAQSTCGAAPDPWEFDVKLNHDLRTLYWVQGGAPIQGQIDAAAQTKLAAKSSHEVRAANERAKLAACALERSDALVVTLNGEDEKPVSDPAATRGFVGSLSYAFTPTGTSDCTDQLTVSGGGYDALPCSVSYEVTGVLTVPPPAEYPP